MAVLDGPAELAGVHYKSFLKRMAIGDPRHANNVVKALMGVAPACSVIVAGVHSTNQSADWDRYAEAIAWSLKQGATVINMSFATRHAGESFKRAIAEADRQGVICVASAAGLGWPGPSDPVVGASFHHQPGAIQVCGAERPDLGPMFGRSASLAAAVVSGIAACAKAYDPGLIRERFVDLAC